MNNFYKNLVTGLCLGLFTLGMASSAFAAKPVDTSTGSYIWNGNNFPSGDHYNLIIHGKKDDFVCPDAEYLLTIIDVLVDDDGVPLDTESQYQVGDELVASECPYGYNCSIGDQVYGNGIFVPRSELELGVLMESGRKGPKKNPDAQTLEVTDWCAGFDNNDRTASLRLPKDKDGYMVFARVHGKPGEPDTNMALKEGCLVSVEEETGDDIVNDLIGLGLISVDGEVYVPDCSADGLADGETLFRYDPDTKGKGVKKATNITGLFEWTGSVCYLSADPTDPNDPYCGADVEPACSALPLCCIDNEPVDEPDGVYEGCALTTLSGTDPLCPITVNEVVYDIPITAQCRDYEEAWVFNIGDFVEYLWGLDNNGTYNVQVRFYPLSEQEWWPLPPLPEPDE